MGRWKENLIDVGYTLGFLAALAASPRVCKPEIYKTRSPETSISVGDSSSVTLGLHQEERDIIKDFKLGGKGENGGWGLEPKEEQEKIFVPGYDTIIEPEADCTISNGGGRISSYGNSMRLYDESGKLVEGDEK